MNLMHVQSCINFVEIIEVHAVKIMSNEITLLFLPVSNIVPIIFMKGKENSFTVFKLPKQS